MEVVIDSLNISILVNPVNCSEVRNFINRPQIIATMHYVYDITITIIMCILYICVYIIVI